MVENHGATPNSSRKVPGAQVLRPSSTQATKGRRGLPLEPNDRLLTRREVERLGVSEWRLDRAVDKGEIHRVRRGDKGRVFYLESEVKAINRRYVEPGVIFAASGSLRRMFNQRRQRDAAKVTNVTISGVNSRRAQIAN